MSEANETRTDWRALLYALYLRGQRDPALDPDEIAYLVAERYPHTAPRLQAIINTPKCQAGETR